MGELRLRLLLSQLRPQLVARALELRQLLLSISLRLRRGALLNETTLVRRRSKLRLELGDARIAPRNGFLKLALGLLFGKLHRCRTLALHNALALGELTGELLVAHLARDIRIPLFVYLEHRTALGALYLVHKRTFLPKTPAPMVPFTGISLPRHADRKIRRWPGELTKRM